MEKKIVVISNGSKEESGSVARSLKTKGFKIETIRLTRGEPLPKTLEDVAGVVVLGGPITVFDQETSPFLKIYFNA